MKGEQQVPWGRETSRIDDGQDSYDTKSVVRIRTESYWKTKEVGEKNFDWLNNLTRWKTRVHGIIKSKSDCCSGNEA